MDRVYEVLVGLLATAGLSASIVREGDRVSIRVDENLRLLTEPCGSRFLVVAETRLACGMEADIGAFVDDAEEAAREVVNAILAWNA